MGRRKVLNPREKDPLFRKWTGIKQRCYNPKATGYENYGGRGITVCDEWRKDGEVFVLWARATGGLEDGATLERSNNDLGYFPENCYWTTHKRQQWNKRNTRYVQVNGVTMPLPEAVEKFSLVSYKTVLSRINDYGWNEEQAVLAPKGNHKVKYVVIQGERLPLKEAVMKYSTVGYNTVISRINDRGWPEERAVLAPKFFRK